ncbi:MAG: phosphoribosyltransferase family protein [Candidatus Saccharimonadales bacterium]
MKDLTINEIINKCGALISDTHVVYSSGKHGDKYFNKNLIFAQPKYVSWIGEKFANHFSDKNIDIVIGPATGGAILSSWTAYYLSKLNSKDVLSLYADKVIDGFVIKRGYDKKIRGKNVLLVEDVLTTGDSIKKVLGVVVDCGGNIAGIASICNRGSLKASDFNIDNLYSLLNLDLKTYNSEDCPFCKTGVPINKDLGHG